MIQDLVQNGVITESQSPSFDPIIDFFMEKLNEADSRAINASKKLSEKALEEYDSRMKKTISTTIKLLERSYANKLRIAASKINRQATDRIVEAIDKYLDIYLAKMLPEGLVVDYDRLNNLERLFESMRCALGVNSKFVYDQFKALSEEADEEEDAEKSKIKDLEEQIAELVDSCSKLKKKLKETAIKNKLDEKLKNVPRLEAYKVRKYFESEDCDVEDIDADFDRVLAMVKKALEDDPTEDDNLDNEIDSIIGADESADDEKEDGKDDEKEPKEDDEKEPKTESITESAMMRSWINKANRIKTI